MTSANDTKLFITTKKDVKLNKNNVIKYFLYVLSVKCNLLCIRKI